MDEWEMGDGQLPETPKKKSRRWLAILLVLAVLGAGGALLWRQFNPFRGSPETVAVDAGVDGGVDAGAQPALSLLEGDALLRKLGADWSKAKEFARWLALEDLVRRLTAAVNLVADGESPAPVLTFLQIKGEFSAQEGTKAKGKKLKKLTAHKRKPPLHPGRMFIAQDSYSRFDSFTEVFSSVDAAAVGRAYGQLRPYFETAYAQIGRPGTKFDDRLVAALRRLTSVKLLEGQVEVVPRGAVYAFKDPAIEALSPAEKHLLRMGPKNGRAVQDTLRKFAASAGFDLTAK